jgi:hypothetical protein
LGGVPLGIASLFSFTNEIYNSQISGVGKVQPISLKLTREKNLKSWPSINNIPG